MSNNAPCSDTVNEDTIQCRFYSLTLTSDGTSWENLCQQVNDTIKALTDGYIWNKDEFQVFIPIFTDSSDAGTPMHLRSTTCFSDNIEDEWYIVHIILEVSKQHPELIIQLKDNDGDFLLIEAADYLQPWANPQTTENRVFIYNNQIHFIPPEVANLTTKLEINEALKIINENPDLTKAQPNIQQAILTRIGTYPQKFLENIHKTAVKLPSHLATLLILKSSLIAPFVDAYCNHDVIDAKCCKNIDFNDCVTIEVKFTKFLYAKLMHSKLINSIRHYAHPQNDTKVVTGLKLMCGFQMIKNKVSATDIYSSKEYFRFLENLKKNGFFKNNIEGSKEYNNMLEKAKDYFSAIDCSVSSHVFHDITQLALSSDYAKVKATLNEKYGIPTGYSGDSEDWFNIKPDDLNDLLSKRYGKESRIKNNDIISSETITKELSSFLKQTSDFEGIEPGADKCDDESIDFDADKFMTCLEKMLNMLSAGDDHMSNSVDSDDDDFDCGDLDEDDDESNEIDNELKAKLQVDKSDNIYNNKSILSNIKQSIKEEEASSGPSSNLLHSLGIEKNKLLDSDDDEVS